jgi:hypothetical protein
MIGLSASKSLSWTPVVTSVEKTLPSLPADRILVISLEL